MLLQPGNHQGTVRNVEVDGQPVPVASAGETADVTLAGIDASALVAGAVLCHPEWPVPVVSNLQARILVLDVPIPILKGRQVCNCSLMGGKCSLALHVQAKFVQYLRAKCFA